MNAVAMEVSRMARGRKAEIPMIPVQDIPKVCPEHSSMAKDVSEIKTSVKRIEKWMERGIGGAAVIGGLIALIKWILPLVLR